MKNDKSFWTELRQRFLQTPFTKRLNEGELKMELKLKPVLILDIHRGIYFGFLEQTKYNEKTVVLQQARHCYYYPVAEVGHKGVYGLATVGPADGAKVGPEVTMTIHDVSKIVDCTPKAVERWQKAKW